MNVSVSFFHLRMSLNKLAWVCQIVFLLFFSLNASAQKASYIGPYKYSAENSTSPVFDSEEPLVAYLKARDTVVLAGIFPTLCDVQMKLILNWEDSASEKVEGVTTKGLKVYRLVPSITNSSYAGCREYETGSIQEFIKRYRVVCASNQRYVAATGRCITVIPIPPNPKRKPCEDPCAPEVNVGQPIDPSTGDMWHVERDYVANVLSGLAISRFYNSSPYFVPAVTLNHFGVGWTHNYDIALKAEPVIDPLYPYGRCFQRGDNPWGSEYASILCELYPANTDIPTLETVPPVVSILRGNGHRYLFRKSGNDWISDADIRDRLYANYSHDGSSVLSWEYLVANGDKKEIFDQNGRLIRLESRSGSIQYLTYSSGNTNDSNVGRIPATSPICARVQEGAIMPAGRLLCVTDQFGKQLNFEYDEKGRVSKVFDPANQATTYQYDGASGGCANLNDPTNEACRANNLTKVVYPDGKERVYFYNEANHLKTKTGGVCYTNTTVIGNGFGHLLHAMTGLQDENGNRLINWNYDCMGHATLSELSSGQERVKVAYLGENTRIVTHTLGTDAVPLSTQSTLRYVEVLGVRRLNDIDLPCVECRSLRDRSYDANGNVARVTDFNGSISDYTYDLSRNLETRRTEASGTAAARTTSTIWHPSYRIPVQVDEPLRRTTYTHDAKGNVLSKTEQATSDVNGSQGANSSVVGQARTWSYTYNTIGQVLTTTGPRTDVNDTTSYTYDTQGNLTSVTNPAGHVTTLSSYDPHGHVGTITDPNGVVTQLTYHPRGWLLSRAVTAEGVTETTNYTYDGVGQMTKVVLPDASEINYTYDDAHRLTKISDHLGNSINYTLDNMGNRIKEEVKDSAGNLTRQMTRVYDALNRLKEVTGGVQ